jgi:hypothetical protein
MLELMDPNRWQVIAATILTVSICVLLHYEVLTGLTRLMRRLTINARARMLVMMPCVMATHAAQIWVFALAYAVLLRNPAHGAITTTIGATAELNLFDYVYFSAMVFTTVGIGDLVPSGHIRLLTGMEALTGLVFITWSASFAFLEMQRFWRADNI